MADRISSSDASVDARIVRLYSKEINRQALDATETHYKLFAHYDEIKVLAGASSAFSDKNANPLLETYKDFHRETEPLPGVSGQTMFVFRDIPPDETGGVEEKRRIDEFWRDSSEPLFFMTMINIGTSGFSEIEKIMEEIQRCYAEQKHLTYVTFDYCDIVIFLRGASFSECARCAFDLDYSQALKERGVRIADSITLYSFSSCLGKLSPEKLTGESFDVYLRFGVTDLARANTFYEDLKKSSQQNAPSAVLSQNVILGRHDFGIFAKNVTLQWLMDAVAISDSVTPPEIEKWFTTRILSVLIPQPASFPSCGTIHPTPTDVSNLQSYIQEQHYGFEKMYRVFCEQNGLTVDNVWLRWLQDASAQALSFLADPMMADLGVCLIPQFLDFYKYTLKLYKDASLLVEHCDKVNAIFQALFTNVSVLVDSMNHSSRQFIQTPPFCTISFEMPPKIMAYYMAVARNLIAALHDGAQTYGFTFSPKFTYSLDVLSLALTDILDKAEFISIGIGEEQLYCLQDTTAVLLHEIAHIVGWRSRCRRKRFLCFLSVALQDLLLDIASDLTGALRERFIENANSEEEAKALQGIESYLGWANLYAFAQHVLAVLMNNHPAFRVAQNAEQNEDGECSFYMRTLLQCAKSLPNYIAQNTDLRQKLYDFLWENLIQDPDKRVSELGRGLRLLAQRRDGMLPDTDNLALAKLDFDRLCFRILERYCVGALSPEEEKAKDRLENTTRYMFNETYADLQAIELLELSCEKYLSLFRQENQKLPAGELPRFLAIAVTMNWSEEETDALLRPLSASKQALLPCVKKICSAVPGEADRARKILTENNINPALLAELLEYLKTCKEQTDERVAADESGRIRGIRQIFGDLSNSNSVLQVIEKLQAFTDEYRQELLRLTTP